MAKYGKFTGGKKTSSFFHRPVFRIFSEKHVGLVALANITIA